MRHLVVGMGEVGSALYKVILNSVEEEVYGFDILSLNEGDLFPKLDIDVLHICFPYSDQFTSYIERYFSLYDPKLVIIHSTVPVGTTRALADERIAYSFIRGRHKSLQQQMRVFEKPVGAVKRETAVAAFKVLSGLGFNATMYSNPEVVELGKLWDTTYYGICIAATKLLKEMTDYYGLDFDDLQEISIGYNRGMRDLGQHNFVRPILEATPGPIGGHCVVPNAKILAQTFDSLLIKEVIECGKED